MLGSIANLGACIQGILGELAVCWEVDSALESSPDVVRKVRTAISSSYSRGMFFYTLKPIVVKTYSVLVGLAGTIGLARCDRSCRCLIR